MADHSAPTPSVSPETPTPACARCGRGWSYIAGSIEYHLSGGKAYCSAECKDLSKLAASPVGAERESRAGAGGMNQDSARVPLAGSTSSGSDASNSVAGYALDARVCEAFGIAGRVMWYARAPGSEDSAWIDGTSREDIERMIREVEARGIVNDWRRGSTAERVVHYPRVSTDMGEAWRVVEKLAEKDTDVIVTRLAPDSGAEVTVWRKNPLRQSYAIAETAPLAICRAALAAVEGTA